MSVGMPSGATAERPSAAGASDASGAGRGANRWLALVVLSLAQLMVVLDSTIVNIALPTAQADLGFSNDARQWVVTGYALAFGSLLLLGGRLSDLLGRKRLFLVGVTGFAVASAVGGAADGFGLLLVARIAQGVFGALLAPAALSLVSVTFAHDAGERGRAFGIFGAVSGAGGAMGLLLGGILTQGVSWRWCLYVNLVIAVIALIGALLWLREGEWPARVRLDLAGTFTSVAGMVGLVYGLGNAAAKGWTAPSTLGPVIAGAVLMAVFVLVERRTAKPLLPLSVVLDRDRGASFVSIGLSGVGSFAVFLFVTYYLVDTLKFSPVQTGTAFLPMVGLLIVGAIVSGALLPRIGPRPLVPIGCLLSAIGMALFTGLGAHSSYATGVLPGLLVLGLGMGLIFGSAQNAATNRVHSQEAGVASAMVNTSQQIGGSIGTAVFSSLAATAVASYAKDHAGSAPKGQILADATLTGYHLVFWISAGVFLACGALTALLFRGGPLTVSDDVPPAAAH